MKKWLKEDWTFEITVVEGEARRCRMGMEKGDVFHCSYDCPAGFCPKTMAQLHTLCEIVRCGGDLRLRGSSERDSIEFWCADHVIRFRLKAIPMQDETEI